MGGLRPLWPGLLLVALATDASGQSQGPKASAGEYEGWRQYSVHCARCHGQDVLGNPVAADLLKSTAPGAAMAEQGAFVQVVRDGRPEKGMPAFASLMSPEQITAVHAYVRARADGSLPPGRPARPRG